MTEPRESALDVVLLERESMLLKNEMLLSRVAALERENAILRASLAVYESARESCSRCGMAAAHSTDCAEFKL